MTDWLEFEGQIVAMPWGENVYTVLPIPDDITEALRAQNTKRVEVELNDHPFNMALTKAPAIDQTFVYTGKSVLTQSGITPGEILDVRLRKTDPNSVEVPTDVEAAVFQNGLTDVWTALSPGKKRANLHMISTAKRAATRAARIEKLMVTLKAD